MDRRLRELQRAEEDDYQAIARYLRARQQLEELHDLQLLFAAHLGYPPVFLLKPELIELAEWDGEERPLLTSEDMIPPCGGAQMLGESLDEVLQHYLDLYQYLAVCCRLLQTIILRAQLPRGIRNQVLESIDSVLNLLSMFVADNHVPIEELETWQRTLVGRTRVITRKVIAGVGVPADSHYRVAETVYNYLGNLIRTLIRDMRDQSTNPRGLAQTFWYLCEIDPHLIDTHQMARAILEMDLRFE
tara:strand:+ start:181 stop:915 length:735 start_codon:yes stop_codon:yes gene_type:complete